MSKIGKTIVILVVLVIVAGLVYWLIPKGPTTMVPPVTETGSSATTNSATQSDVTNTASQSTVTASSSVDADLNAIDSQMNGLNQDNSNVNESVASSSAQ